MPISRGGFNVVGQPGGQARTAMAGIQLVGEQLARQRSQQLSLMAQQLLPRVEQVGWRQASVEMPELAQTFIRMNRLNPEILDSDPTVEQRTRIAGEQVFNQLPQQQQQSGYQNRENISARTPEAEVPPVTVGNQNGGAIDSLARDANLPNKTPQPERNPSRVDEFKRELESDLYKNLPSFLPTGYDSFLASPVLSEEETRGEFDKNSLMALAAGDINPNTVQQEFGGQSPWLRPEYKEEIREMAIEQGWLTPDGQPKDDNIRRIVDNNNLGTLVARTYLSRTPEQHQQEQRLASQFGQLVQADTAANENVIPATAQDMAQVYYSTGLNSISSRTAPGTDGGQTEEADWSQINARVGRFFGRTDNPIRDAELLSNYAEQQENPDVKPEFSEKTYVGTDGKTYTAEQVFYLREAARIDAENGDLEFNPTRQEAPASATSPNQQAGPAFDAIKQGQEALQSGDVGQIAKAYTDAVGITNRQILPEIYQARERVRRTGVKDYDAYRETLQQMPELAQLLFPDQQGALIDQAEQRARAAQIGAAAQQLSIDNAQKRAWLFDDNGRVRQQVLRWMDEETKGNLDNLFEDTRHKGAVADLIAEQTAMARLSREFQEQEMRRIEEGSGEGRTYAQTIDLLKLIIPMSEQLGVEAQAATANMLLEMLEAPVQVDTRSRLGGFFQGGRFEVSPVVRPSVGNFGSQGAAGVPQSSALNYYNGTLGQ